MEVSEHLNEAYSADAKSPKAKQFHKLSPIRGAEKSAQRQYGRNMSSSKQTTNTRLQLRSRWSLRPSANGLANALTCYKGYSAIQVPHALHLTCRIAPFRDGSCIDQTTSVNVGTLVSICSTIKMMVHSQ